jgi:2-phosphosulfolactate phosphatase
MRQLRVHFLPDAIVPSELAGSSAVVIDVLRASTTIVYALAAGARAVVPCATIASARERAVSLPKGQAILGGERGGLPIEGFALGNSPAEYTSETVGGKTLVLTTTNGTRALLHCASAAEVAIAAFVNLSAVCKWLADRSRVDLVCAGTDGQLTREDALVAGAIVCRLRAGGDWRPNDDAIVAGELWRPIIEQSPPAELRARVVEAMRESLGGQNLIAIGMEHDIELAAEIDRFDIVPRFDSATGEIALNPVH